ncbi:MAG: cation diffusion facilitator family transporter [Bacilli bacterium]|nr:cation diffusion facilitator family transporter [Bacilli bacterium]
MNREKEIIKTSIVGIVGNILLVAAKATIGLIANSVAIISDAINNLTDALSSIITIIGTKLSNKKPDKKHPYGHGRIEYLTSMIIAVIVLFAGFSAIYESINSLINKTEATYNTVSIIIVSIAIVIKLLLGLYFRYKGKKVSSDALKASGVDALFDALLSTSTLIGMIVAMTARVNIEGYLGILIGLFIIKSGFGILKDAFSAIVGQRAEKEVSDGIKQLVCSFPEVIGAYDLILNDYGPNKAIGSIHIEVRDDLTAKEIHPLSREIAAAAYLKYGVILTVGVYARNDSDEEVKEIRDYIVKLLKEYPFIKQLHGFYLDEEKSYVSFDLIFDFENPNSEENVAEIKAKLKEKFPKYEFYIVIDTDFAD